MKKFIIFLLIFCFPKTLVFSQKLFTNEEYCAQFTDDDYSHTTYEISNEYMFEWADKKYTNKNIALIVPVFVMGENMAGKFVNLTGADEPKKPVVIYFPPTKENKKKFKHLNMNDYLKVKGLCKGVQMVNITWKEAPKINEWKDCIVIYANDWSKVPQSELLKVRDHY